MQMMFELKATSTYGAIVDKPTSKETEFWINAGLDILYKTRWSGINSKRLAYEQDQKRIEDLRNLKRHAHITLGSSDTEWVIYPTYARYDFKLPANYFITTGESVTIRPTKASLLKCWERGPDGEPAHAITTLIECTDDNIDEKLTNSLSDHRFHGTRTRPLRVHNHDVISVYTDTNYEPTSLHITYLKKPDKIDIHTNPQMEYMEFPEHLHSEIVNTGVRLYLENKANPRYNTFASETMVME